MEGCESWEDGAVSEIDMKTSADLPYHDQNATINPNHEKKKVRPYVVDTGLRNGIDRALWLIGLTSGARQSSAKVSMTAIPEE